MKKSCLYFFRCLLLMSLVPMQVYGAKYRPINEIPGQVPETAEEKEIWDIGREHQDKVRQNGEVIQDEEMERHLEELASKLLGDIKDSIGLEVDVLIFKDPGVNAWVYPNGSIAVQTGLLSAMQNEAQLAAILAHEISHFLNRHAFVQIKSKQTQSAIGKGLGFLATAAVAAKTGAVDTSLMGAGQVWTDLVTSGYSRKLETHADEQGLELLVAAGFDPNQALPAFEELRIKDDDEVNLAKVWSSHPDIDSRLSNLKKQIKKIDLPPSYIPEASDYVEKYGNAMLVDAKLNILGQHYDQADKVLSSYLKYKKDEPLAYYLLGENLRKRSPDGPGFSNRIEAYTRAVSLDQNFAPAYKELGMVYRQQGENAKAADSLLQYLALEPDSIDAPIISWYVAQLGGSQGGQK